MKTLSFLSTLFFVFFGAQAIAGPGFDIEGKLIQTDGVTPVTGSVQLVLQIRTPDSSNCLMYQEAQTVTADSKGAFSLTMNNGVGTRQDASGLTFAQIFSNSTPFTFIPSACTGSTTYNPAVGDGRSLAITFQSSTMTTAEALPAIAMTYAPLSIEAEQVGGYAATSLLRTDSSVTGGTSPLNNTQYAALVSLINGTSTAYQPAGNATNGTPVYSTSSGTIGSTVVGDMWLDTSTAGSDVLKINTDAGVKAIPLTTGGSFVTSVAAGTGTTVTNASGVATVGIKPSGVSATELASGSVTSAKLDPAIVISTSGSIATSSSLSVSAGVTAGFVTTPSMTTKVIGLSNSVSTPSTISLYAPSSAFTSYSLAFPSSAGLTGQVLTADGNGNMYWNNSLTNTLAPGKILVGNASSVPTAVAISGDATINNAGAVTVQALQGTAVAATTPIDGQVLVYSNSNVKWIPQNFSVGSLRTATGATQFSQANCTHAQTLTWSSLTDAFSCTNIAVDASALTSGTIDPARLPASASAWSVNGTNLYETVGNVGIGTTTPTSALDVESRDSSLLSVLNTSTATTGTITPNMIVTKIAPASASTSVVYGLSNNIQASGNVDQGLLTGLGTTVANSATGAVGGLTGERILINNNAGTTLAASYGTNTTISNNSAGTVTAAYGSTVSIANTNGGAITNAYGYYVGTIQGTNRYSLYASDITSPSYFAGNVGIGTTAPLYKLDVNGAVNATALYINGAAVGPGGSTPWIASGPNISNTNSGYVGIGTTAAPVAKLDVNGGINAARYLSGNSVVLGTGSSSSGNISVGTGSMPTTTGTQTIAIGLAAMPNPTSAFKDIAIGGSALNLLTTGNANIAIGDGSLAKITTGQYNTAVGSAAASNVGATNSSDSSNTIVGALAGIYLGTTGTANNNILLGAAAGNNLTQGNGNILIGTNVTAPSPTTSYFMDLGNAIYATGLSGNPNVGIGTSAPGYKLDVAGQVNATAFSIAGVPISVAGSNSWALNGTSLYNTNTGNVGIGTTAPAFSLDVVGPINSSSTFAINGTTAVSYYAGTLAINASSAARGVALYSGSSASMPSLVVANGSGNIGIGTDLPSVPLHTIGTVAHMSGYVGVGTTAPTALIDAQGSSATAYLPASAGLSSPVGSRISVSNTNSLDSSSAFLGLNATNTAGTTNSAHIGVVATAGGWAPSIVIDQRSGATAYAERFRIDPSGNIGIGTIAPVAKLDVAGPILSEPTIIGTGTTTLDLSTSNTFTIANASGGGAFTLSNPVNGGNYTVAITDTTSRMYTFACSGNTKYQPANAATTASTTSIYSIFVLKNGSNYDCYVKWTTGFQ